MEVIKRTINLEEYTDRENKSKSWGAMTASTFFIKIILTQTMDDMGLFTDIDFVTYDKANSSVDYTILKDKLSKLNISFPFMKNKPNPIFTNLNTPYNSSYVLRYPTSTEKDYYNYVNAAITGMTESKVEDLKSYDRKISYRTGFDINKEKYTNYKGDQLTGVDRIKSYGEPKIYVFDTVNDANLGTQTQTTGLRYVEYTGKTRSVTIDNETRQIPLTIVNYIGEGFNTTNISFSGLTKEEYLLGIISVPEVYDDVFIERGVNNVFENHLRLAEIKSLGDVATYNGGYFNVTRQ
jgi:hypothetical protein